MYEMNKVRIMIPTCQGMVERLSDLPKLIISYVTFFY